MNREFSRRRTQNWVLLGLLYSFFYMTRYNFSAVVPQLSKTFGWTNTQLGLFETMWPLVYGLSVVFNGPLSDRIGGKKTFLFGAAGVTLMNFAFGACTLFVESPAILQGTGHAARLIAPAILRHGMTPGALVALMATIWGINGYFQSFGALSIVKVNAQWFNVRERGTFSGVFGVLIRLGLVLAFSGVPLILIALPLRYAFWLPGASVAVLFGLNYFFMEESPKDAGLGEFDTGDETGDAKGASERPSLAYIFKKIFASPAVWMIALCSMMIGMVRRSTIDAWYPKYFSDIHLGHAATSVASFLPYQAAVWGIAAVGIAGGFVFGIASDRVYGGRRAPVVTLAFIGMAVTLAIFGVLDRMALGPWPAVICLSVLSFFVNGAHGIVSGAASMDFGGRKAAATATGLFDGMQYLASSPVGIGMGYMLDHWGWSMWQWMPIPFALIGALVMSRLWNVLPSRAGHDASAPLDSAGKPLGQITKSATSLS